MAVVHLEDCDLYCSESIRCDHAMMRLKAAIEGVRFDEAAWLERTFAMARSGTMYVDKPPRTTRVRVFTDGGPWVQHNMPCAVCHTNKAVMYVNTGVLEPCWDCQRAGWRVVKRGWLGRLVDALFNRVGNARLASECLPTTPPSDSLPPKQVYPKSVDGG